MTMNKKISFIIPGNPKGKGRPRMTRSGHTYTPKDTAQYENLVKLAFEAAKPQRFIPFEGPVKAIIEAGYEIPKSWSKKKRELALEGIEEPTKKPDLDNIAKSILDSLNGIAYRDDSQVTKLEIRKRYTLNPAVQVIIEFIE